MTELEIMQRAKMYMDKLARGVDPISGQAVHYSREAQQFILDHLMEILREEKEGKRES